MKILSCGVAVIEGDEAHAKWIEELGTIHHDPWFRDQVLKHINPGDVVVQGGANIGTLTRAMLEAGAAVVTFEPNKQAYECLWRNCPKNLFPRMVVHVEGGLSDELGVIGFVIEKNNAGASHFSFGPKPEIYARVVPLDGFSAIDGVNVRLILLDIEGWEVRALRGARETIARCRPTIICEVNRGALERAGTSDAELFDLLDQCGYSIQVMQPDCKIGDLQYDILCLPK